MAGRVFPPEAEVKRLTTRLTSGERTVYDLFCQALVPEGWDLYVQPHLNGLRPDFVLLHPQNGIAVFEVKDFNFQSIRYSCQKDAQGNSLVTGTYAAGTFTWRGLRNPFQKVRLYRDHIAELYCPRLDTVSGLKRITAGLIFPNASRLEIQEAFGPRPYEFFGLSGEWDRLYPVVGGDLLRPDSIASVFPFHQSPIEGLSPEMLDDLRNWLNEPTLYSEQRMPLEDEIARNRQQSEIVHSDNPPEYRRLRGAAGSGKSLVVAARAAELAIRNKDVLIVNYNITLRNYLRDHASRYRRDTPRRPITFLHFHDWCKTVCALTGHLGEYDEIWKSCDPINIGFNLDRVVELTDHILHSDDVCLASTYDAILVDEGQDFSPQWWNILRTILKEGGEMLLVADRAQDIYQQGRAWTEEAMTSCGFHGRWNEFKITYRLPPALIPHLRRFAGRYLSKSEGTFPDDPQGELGLSPFQMVWIQTEQQSGVARCVEAIKALPRGSRNLSWADICVITDHRDTGLHVVEQLEMLGIRVHHTLHTADSDRQHAKRHFYKGSSEVKVTTIHSFKGWEGRAIVVLMSGRGVGGAAELLYTALTRVKHHDLGSWLTVISCIPEWAEFGLTWQSTGGPLS